MLDDLVAHFTNDAGKDAEGTCGQILSKDCISGLTTHADDFMFGREWLLGGCLREVSEVDRTVVERLRGL